MGQNKIKSVFSSQFIFQAGLTFARTAVEAFAVLRSMGRHPALLPRFSYVKNFRVRYSIDRHPALLPSIRLEKCFQASLTFARTVEAFPSGEP